MIPTTNALLICVLFLCGLEETVLSQHGHCTEKQCFALFLESKDFPSAQKRCKEFGQLFEFSLEHLEKIFKSIPSGLSGSYWLDLHGTGSKTGLQKCSSISVSTERNFTVLSEPCSENLSGFLCQYTLQGKTCSGLQAGGSVQDFVEEDGVCVNVSICANCEHMLCDKVSGVYGCVCRKGYKVSARDPTKCERNCTERDCPAKCIPNPDIVQKDLLQCFCPDGYILDVTNTTTICTDIDECETEKPCDHKCENLNGGFTCLCNKGFKLHKGYKCVSIDEEVEEEEEGSGSTPPYPTLAGAHPAAVPSYVKTGSVLGITVFLVLLMALLFFLVHNAIKRCGKFQLHSFKHPNIDIFYLQQVTTETYKRLSFDKPFKNDPQIL
uniref:Thrombomodulin n=1 Tax=Dicentrarchus labrax TaxID=13489 RepID=A0A8C4GWT7_DICLA